MSSNQDLASNFLAQLHNIRKDKGGRIEVDDVAKILESIMGAVKDKMSVNDKAMYFEIKSIAAKIKDSKGVDGKAIKSNISGKSVDEANLDLNAVIKATEKATNEILDAVEKIQGVAKTISEDARKQIDQYASKIYEACSFQDITGQVIKRVVGTLLDVEKGLDNVLGGKPSGVAAAKKDGDKALMHGPQMGGKAPSQADIDKLFDSLDDKKSD